MIRLTIATAVLVSGFAIAPGKAQEKCSEIHFSRGASSTTVKGTAPFEPPFACYTFATGRGQTAIVRLTRGGPNTAFNIDGVVDNQDHYSFRTAAKAYKIQVYETAKTPNTPFEMMVEVKP